MALDGIMFEGVSVRVRRPTDYNPVAAASLGPSEPNPHLNVQAIGLQPGGSGMVSHHNLRPALSTAAGPPTLCQCYTAFRI